jgi:hypothetical protein
MQQLTSLFQSMGANNLAGQNISPVGLASHFGSPDQFGLYGTSPVGSSGGGLTGAGLLSAANTGGATPLRAPAGWTPPLTPPPGTEAAQRTAARPSGGSSAMGSGTGMMGPLATARRRDEASAAELDEPIAEQKAVVTSLGFDVFDDSAAVW